MRSLRLLPFLFLSAACDCDGGGDLSTLRPKLVVTPTALDFGRVPLGERKALTVTLANQGEAALSLDQVRLETSTGAFSLESVLPKTLGPNASLDVVVIFLPNVPELSLGSIRLTTNDEASPSLRIPLRGVGILPRLTAIYPGPSCPGESSSSALGKVAVGNSVVRTVVLEANGDSAVTLTEVNLETTSSPEWTLQMPENLRIEPGQRVEVGVRFAPADFGVESATLLVRSDAANRPELRISFCGEGAEASLCGQPVPVDLGRVILGTTATETLRISNCGSLDTSVEALAISSDAAHPSDPAFGLAGVPTLPITLAPEAATNFEVTFTPTEVGQKSGFVAARADTGEIAYFAVQAQGVEDCKIDVLPQQVNFGTVATGQQAERGVLIANSSARACTVLSLNLPTGTGFALSQAPTAPFTVAPGGAEVITVRFSPQAAGLPEQTQLTVTSGGGVEQVALLGNVDGENGCQLTVMPGFVRFGAVARGNLLTLGVEVRNDSRNTCQLNEVSLDPLSDPGFADPTLGLGALQPGERRQLTVTYRPFRVGPATGNVVLRSDDANDPELRIPLFGTSPSPSICVTPRHLDFGAAAQPSVRTLTIVGCGATEVVISDLVFSVPDQEMNFVTAPQLPLRLAPSQSYALEVRYAPQDQLGDTAEIAIGSDDPADPIVYVSVTGGAQIAPVEAGRFLYYWEIPNSGGDIIKMPLQGALVPQPYWGASTGNQCAGCHTISSDGRYLAVIGEGGFNLRVVDTEFDVEVTLPFTASNASFITWRPDPNSLPPYKFIYSDGDRLHVASVFGGYLGELMGANDPSRGQKMATWGPDGNIVFTRGEMGGGFGFYGPTDLMVIDEDGGNPVPLAGASNNGSANYYPQFSPDGRWIAYTFSASAQGTLSAQDGVVRLVRPDQSGQVLLLPNSNSMPGDGASSFPTWSKDGRFLSFSSNRSTSINRSWDIYIAPIDPMTGQDGPAQPLSTVNTPFFEHAAQWSP